MDTPVPQCYTPERFQRTNRSEQSAVTPFGNGLSGGKATPTLESKTAAHAASESPDRARRRLRRLPIALVLVAAASGGWLLSQPGAARVAALRALHLRYAIHDPAQAFPKANLGPAARESHAPDPASVAERIEAIFPGASVRVSIEEPPRFTANDFFFEHEPVDSPTFSAFAEATRSIWAPAKDPFDLCQRFRSLNEHGDPTLALPEDDPLAYFRAARAKVPLTCRYYAMTFVELCLAKGYTARMLGLSFDGTHWDHAVAEVYLPERGKWVLIDPDFNIAYRRSGDWRNAAEIQGVWRRILDEHGGGATGAALLDRIHRAARSEKPLTDLEAVPLGPAGEALRRTNLEPSPSQQNLQFFQYVLYGCRNDFVTNRYPTGHPKSSTQYLLTAIDAAAPPAICPEAIAPRTRETLYPDVGACWIDLDPSGTSGSASIAIVLGTYTPNFQRFETRLNGGGWRPTPPETSWDLASGENRLEVRSIHLRGMAGPVSRWTAKVEPATDPANSPLERP